MPFCICFDVIKAQLCKYAHRIINKSLNDMFLLNQLEWFLTYPTYSLSYAKDFILVSEQLQF